MAGDGNRYAAETNSTMFCSLDRADIVLKPDSDGRSQFVQTDHRTTEDIESAQELSAVFALIRILNPKRMAEPGSPEPMVICSFQDRPPEFLRVIISSTGGRCVYGDNLTTDADLPAPQPLDQVINSSFAALALAVSREFQADMTTDGLRKIEERLTLIFQPADEDENAYWSAVLKLGAFGGELIRKFNGGDWTKVETGTLPFALTTSFRGESATVNPLGKAIKFFANGSDDSLVALVNMLRQNL